MSGIGEDEVGHHRPMVISREGGERGQYRYVGGWVVGMELPFVRGRLDGLRAAILGG